MAISRKEKEVPKNLPPARIYLDDLEMVIRVFQEAKESQPDKAQNQPVLKFELEGQECTELTDLPKITEGTKNFSMIVTMPGFSAILRISPKSTYWDTFGLERKEEWSIHSRLEPIFRAREKRLVALAHKIPPYSFWVGMSIIVGVALIPRLVEYSMPFVMSPHASLPVPSAFLGALIVLMLIQAALASSHTIVVLSRYSESSAERDKSFRSKIWDVAKIVLAAVVGALIYKFWPKP